MYSLLQCAFFCPEMYDDDDDGDDGDGVDHQQAMINACLCVFSTVNEKKRSRWDGSTYTCSTP